MAQLDKKKYQIDSLEIVSEILEVKVGENGSKVAKIRMTCGDKSRIEYSTDVGPEEGYGERLSDTQLRKAEQYVKEIRGTADQPLIFQGIRVYLAQKNSWSSIMVSNLDENLPYTLLQRGVVDLAELNKTGERFTIDYGNNLLKEEFVHLAKLKYGDDVYDAKVIPCDMQIPCVLGRDLIEQIKKKGSKYYYQLKDNDLNRAYRNAIRSKKSSVLIIGSFGKDDRIILDEFKGVLFGHGYRGVMIDEFDDVKDQTLEEKMIFFASMCKFVICVDSNPAGHYVELSTCARCGFITAVILADMKGRTTSSMIADIELRNPFIKLFNLAGNDKNSIIKEILTWSNLISDKKSTQLDVIYGYRNGGKGS